MKKFIVFAVVLALLVPAAAFAATEFSLGGFIKLDAMWDSNNAVGKNLTALPTRNNDVSGTHGRLKIIAQGSRFSFTIKGPKLWGADITGFLEMDFDVSERSLNAAYNTNFTPRLRHAMFRFNWPTSELLFGQYWSMFCEWYAEAAEDACLQMTGTPTHRLAQIRFTQKFMEDWTVAGLIGDPNQANLPAAATVAYNANVNNGQSAESPHVQAKVTYAHDWWGKAAYYGKPIPFTAQVVAGWQRNVLRENAFAANTLGTDINGFPVFGFAINERDLPATAVPAGWNVINRNQYVNPWMVMSSFFIPVIPTTSANLAGTASILTQWWIGQGVEAFGFSGVAGNIYKFRDNLNNTLVYDAELMKKFGGFVQGQYYFNNQWFANAAYGVSKVYNVNRSRMIRGGAVFGANGMEYAMADEAQTIQQIDLTLWYRPIQAIKFGLQYSYAAVNYFQYRGPSNVNAGAATNATLVTTAAPQTNNVNRSNFGNDHRVEFVGYFYF